MNLVRFPTSPSARQMDSSTSNDIVSNHCDKRTVSEPSDSNSGAVFDKVTTIGRNSKVLPSSRQTEKPSGNLNPTQQRTSMSVDLGKNTCNSAPPESPTPPTGCPRKRVLLGTWRDSNVTDKERKHAVVGFINTRGRLRTQILPKTQHGDSLAKDFPLPPGSGRTWVTFGRIIFSDHLIGLKHSEVKEYTRLRLEGMPEETEEQRVKAEHAAVDAAKRHVKENTALENPSQSFAVAYGIDVPEPVQRSASPDLKRRRISGGFVAINPTPPETVPKLTAIPTPPHYTTAHQNQVSNESLSGTRPTRILLGCWIHSTEANPTDYYAAYGVLDKNNIFRVRVVRETRDGRCVDGNYPSDPGELWIPFEEVAFEPHLKPISSSKKAMKEYCRVRQSQLDQGETSAERVQNEEDAVKKALLRVKSMPSKNPLNPTVPTYTASPQGDGHDAINRRHGYSGHELRQSRTTEPRPIRALFNENDLRGTRLQSVDAVERTNALARREIARAEAAQGRADRYALHWERAAAAAAADTVTAANAAAAAASNMRLEQDHSNTNGRMLFHESDDMQRLNKVWARQETLHMKGGPDDAKIYDGIKYERKATGPFMGKLVSQGTIINIDGEDYVEYRVLTKPSFF